VKKVLKAVIVLFLVVCSTKIYTVSADSTDVFFTTDLYGTTGSIISNNSFATLQITSGSISGGVVGADGVSITVDLKDGYIFEKLIIEDSVITPATTSHEITLSPGDVISKIYVSVIDTVDAYNKPITVNVSNLEYGTKLSDVTVSTNDTDLVLMGKNMFDYYLINSQPNLEPTDTIDTPGSYAIFTVFDSQEFGHFPGNENHFYYNNVTVPNSYFIDAEVVSDYGIEYATKSVSVDDDTKNHYLYLLSYFYLSGLSVEYLSNAGQDSVTNMPANEPNAYLKDAPVTIDNTSTPVREGYEFLGWSLTSTGSVYSEATIKMPADGLKLYAIWKNNNEQTPIEETTYKEEIAYEPIKIVTTGVDR